MVFEVYFQGKKGKNRNFYIFIRFMDVEDKLEPEKAIDGITQKGRMLTINLENVTS